MVSEDRFGFRCKSLSAAASQILVKQIKMIVKKKFRYLMTDEGLLHHILVLRIYTIFRLVFALTSLENDALKFFIFVIPSISFSKYRINSFQNKHRNVAKYTSQSCKLSKQTSNSLIIFGNVLPLSYKNLFLTFH